MVGGRVVTRLVEGGRKPRGSVAGPRGLQIAFGVLVKGAWLGARLDGALLPKAGWSNVVAKSGAMVGLGVRCGYRSGECTILYIYGICWGHHAGYSDVVIFAHSHGFVLVFLDKGKVARMG